MDRLQGDTQPAGPYAAGEASHWPHSSLQADPQRRPDPHTKVAVSRAGSTYRSATRLQCEPVEKQGTAALCRGSREGTRHPGVRAAQKRRSGSPSAHLAVFVLSLASERIRAVVSCSAPVAHIGVVARKVKVRCSDAAAVAVLDEAWPQLVLGHPRRSLAHLVQLVHSVPNVAPAVWQNPGLRSVRSDPART